MLSSPEHTVRGTEICETDDRSTPMLSKLLPAFLCGLSLAAQIPSTLQDTLNTAGTASKAGDFDAALNQYESAFDLTSASDASQIPRYCH
jgi:hypothetical protein